MEENNNILSRYDAVAKQAVNFGIDAHRYFTVFDLKCQIALVLGADVEDVKDCLSVYDVDYLIYKTYGGELSKLDLISDYDVLVATITILDSVVDTSLIDSEYIAERTLVNLLVPVQSGYFYLEPLNDNTEFTINSVDGAPVLNLEYSMDGKTWQNWDYKTNRITANANERVYLRGQNEEWTTITGADDVFNRLQYNSIISMSNAQFNIGGRLSSLFTGNEDETDKSIIMSAIFYNSSCRDASKLIVPKNAKLSYAFSGCRDLISAPRKLSDSIQHNNQYMGMFESCKSLLKAPQLPATILGANSYHSMFNGCSSLTSFNFGDQSIFAGSSGNLQQMFKGCSKLSYIRCLFDDRDGAGPREYTNWVSGVASQGTFVTNTDKWKRGANGIPNGWEVVID